MEYDPEIIDAFAQEIKAIADELTPIVEGLRTNHAQPALYEKFGQVIDRIYGTAATLEFKVIADYCRDMKALTYKCSQSKNPYAMNQVKDLVLVGLQLVKKMEAVARDPNQIKKLQYTMQKERERGLELSRKLFGAIKRTSTAA